MRVVSGGNSSPTPILKRSSIDVAPGVPRKGPLIVKKRVMSRITNLDLLDQRRLTSFPRIGEANNMSFVEDYFTEEESIKDTESMRSTKESLDIPEKRSAQHTCGNCSKFLVIDACYKRGDNSFLCMNCAEICPIAASTIIKAQGPEGVYFVLENNKEWYSTIRKRLRWRWRIKGLI
ncbi:hypothetical protein TRVA0_015S02498 [Trichomonascus vanleenenianus]|uniref:uncharacterized protein n=1 Tax=Trichomonascus vanleenenianus TaxID=2268995 RepID=UPI003ECB69F6